MVMWAWQFEASMENPHLDTHTLTKRSRTVLAASTALASAGVVLEIMIALLKQHCIYAICV
ncbi:hypothetical protein IQ07DRAFT_195052 [Pyrenochaeta sp. DS3sAY3a]|nr:hypothetical protein IQ07DRAFT_195052 [Pyrenochaeta sp. DS3sAY3a]